MVHFIVDRLHVSASNREVIAELKKRLKPEALSRAHRKDRFALYRAGLKRHLENKKLYYAVVSGRF